MERVPERDPYTMYRTRSKEQVLLGLFISTIVTQSFLELRPGLSACGVRFLGWPPKAASQKVDTPKQH